MQISWKKTRGKRVIRNRVPKVEADTYSGKSEESARGIIPLCSLNRWNAKFLRKSSVTSAIRAGRPAVGGTFGGCSTAAATIVFSVINLIEAAYRDSTSRKALSHNKPSKKLVDDGNCQPLKGVLYITLA